MKDGGLAFPYEERTGDGLPHTDHFGMTLRDYFAAKAMQAILTAKLWPEVSHLPTPPQVARDAYIIADAMLAARKKGVE